MSALYSDCECLRAFLASRSSSRNFFCSRLGERSLAIEGDALAQRNRKHHGQLVARWIHFPWPWLRTGGGSPALLDGGVAKLASPSNSGWDTRQQLHHKIGSGVVLCTAL